MTLSKLMELEFPTAKIYKIICSETGRVYVGSTVATLQKRLYNHIHNPTCNCKDFINPKIFLVEEYPCDRKTELLWRERYWIEKTDCVNYFRPIITKDERREQKYKYHNKNREKMGS